LAFLPDLRRRGAEVRDETGKLFGRLLGRGAGGLGRRRESEPAQHAREEERRGDCRDDAGVGRGKAAPALEARERSVKVVGREAGLATLEEPAEVFVENGW